MGRSEILGVALTPFASQESASASIALIAAPGAGKALAVYSCIWTVEADVATAKFQVGDGTTVFASVTENLKGVPYGFKDLPHYVLLAENTALTMDKDSDTTKTSCYGRYRVVDLNAKV